MNCTNLIGRMTKNPELRYTSNNQPVASFNLAVNRPFKTNDGQQNADFIPCVIWGTKAVNVDKYCSKGSLVGVTGRLQSRSYENAQGQTVFVLELVCDSVQFLETKKNDNQAINHQAPQQSYNYEERYAQQEKEYAQYSTNNPNDPYVQKDFGTSLDIASDDLPF